MGNLLKTLGVGNPRFPKIMTNLERLWLFGTVDHFHLVSDQVTVGLKT